MYKLKKKKVGWTNWFFHLLTFELDNYFLSPQDLRKIMRETEKPPPALPDRVSHLLLWASHSLLYVYKISLLQRLSQSFEKVYNEVAGR